MMHFLSLLIPAVLFIAAGRAQITVHLPDSVSLTVNERPFPVSENWTDSLMTEAALGKFCFVIVGARSSPDEVKTNIQIPQVFPLSAVYRQIILYYAMLEEEDSRKKERLNIYPYFSKLNQAPFLTAGYNTPGRYTVVLKKWPQEAVPRPPNLIEREIFNQILQTSFSGVEIFSSLSDEIFDKIAGHYNVTAEEIRSLYRNTLLWQQYQQFYDRRSCDSDPGARRSGGR